MAKNKKHRTSISKEDLMKIERSAVREEKKEQGFFDGRFRTRSVNDRSKYDRKVKHKNKPTHEL
jgi:Fic family protein